ncbi:hypothetical protein GJ496_010394 [Pomphorhynchus laevis]|nr:hypothetical protein GJ496_010394 [Pomphorhynchus laevis]
MSDDKKELNLKEDIENLLNSLKSASASTECKVEKEKINSSIQALESNLFESVRNVYESFFNSLTSSNAKARSIAASKATVAAFTAAYGYTHPRIIKLRKRSDGFGFNVMGGKEQRSPILVSKIVPGGAAADQGQLKRGDQLLSVNGINIEHEYHETAVEVLKNAGQEETCLVVRYMPGMLKDMEEKLLIH